MCEGDSCHLTTNPVNALGLHLSGLDEIKRLCRAPEDAAAKSSGERVAWMQALQPEHSVELGDDRAFLMLLEQLRQLHCHSSESQRHPSPTHTDLGSDASGSSLSRWAPSGTNSHQSTNTMSLTDRSGSADTAEERSAFNSNQASEVVSADLSHPTLPLLSCVGHASGQDSKTFTDDTIWRHEVRALFVLRELDQTERSYAQHLASLLRAVQALISQGAAAAHLHSLATMLPMLLTASHALHTHLCADPTAVGVGTAFEAAASRFEATFVAWSFAVPDIMAGLRAEPIHNVAHAASGSRHVSDSLSTLRVRPSAGSAGVNAKAVRPSAPDSSVCVAGLTAPSVSSTRVEGLSSRAMKSLTASDIVIMPCVLLCPLRASLT